MIRVLFAALAVVSPVSPMVGPQTVPLTDLVPGSSCYGLTVLRGTTPERFECVVDTVIENFAGYRHVVQITLTGEPIVSKRDGLVSGTGVLGGMSGSPVYLKDGRLIGSLIIGYTGQRNAATAYLDPVDDMRAMRAIAPKPSGPLASTLPPGSFVAMCTMWGQFERCVASTVTFDDGSYVFITGHVISGLDVGPLRLPLFEMPVSALVATFERGMKVGGTLGAPVGVVVYNGWHGGLVRTGDTVPGIPATVTVKGLSDEPLVRTCRIAAHENASIDFAEGVAGYLDSLGVKEKKFKLMATVRLPQGKQMIFRGAPLATLMDLAKTLSTQWAEGVSDDSVPESIDIVVSRPEAE